MREEATIVEVNSKAILVEGDRGEAIIVLRAFVTGIPRVGAPVTLVKSYDRLRAFVAPVEAIPRITSDPDESGVQLIGRFFEEVLGEKTA